MLIREIVLPSDRREELEYCLKSFQELNTKIDIYQGKELVKVTVNVDEELCHRVKEVIARLIVTRRKSEFIMKRLNVKEYTLCLSALVSALIYFEHNQEMARVTKELNNFSCYNVDGICDFRLGDLKEDWIELVDLTNSLLDSGYNEIDIYNVASFMIAPRVVAEKSVFIADCDTPLLTNVSRGGMIEVVDIFHNSGYNLINTIISECPSEIIVEGELMNNSIVQTLKNLYKVRVI